ncbi:hypothetical protein TNCV_1857881 [Trichonephila clavipes]|nr:hypothetical protein TNCV_1857881 [Trichonephila clavipes]
MVPELYCGRGSKVTDSWQACHEFEPSADEDPPCRGAMHVKSVESSNVLPLGLKKKVYEDSPQTMDDLKMAVTERLPFQDSSTFKCFSRNMRVIMVVKLSGS